MVNLDNVKLEGVDHQPAVYLAVWAREQTLAPAAVRMEKVNNLVGCWWPSSFSSAKAAA